MERGPDRLPGASDGKHKMNALAKITLLGFFAVLPMTGTGRSKKRVHIPKFDHVVKCKRGQELSDGVVKRGGNGRYADFVSRPDGKNYLQ